MTEGTYKQAGVDLEASQSLKRRIRDIVTPTHGPQVLAGVGAFGAMYQFAGYKDPILVSSTDPVGTKLRLAVMMERYDTIGVDLVNACINDVIVCGARPIFFLDYINMSSLRPDVVEELVGGMAQACQEVNCALIGGETAEMPGVFAEGNFDVSGFVVGVVEKSEMIDPTTISKGDVLIGVPSNGLHTNGYSLVRHVYGLDTDPSPLHEIRPELGESLGDALLRPHPPYLDALAPVFSQVKGIAHITGGGLIENVPRMLPDNVTANFDTRTWPIPPIFTTIQEDGGIPRDEMYRVFNMGLGMVLVCDPSEVDAVVNLVPDSMFVGEISSSSGDEQVVLQS
ncbi:MAG: phosphoribosylformylglycinamidine cyclo-ligase [SAR202 cluster bacterium]|jgi:phosphoribosylformylglycinamidine cyclo-ligase|nr:phosphoribosylformylglycinamidine cyclo-ligase [SAR202 cluster bacterium]MDP6713715.1 phosphoribosylformylglycinamidine cyclo-ligase [SAR202 cluster bacterium]